MRSNKIKFWLLILLPCFLFIISSLLIKYHPQPICLWKNLSGYNCPGCGITRAFHSLCILDFKSAYNYNPSIFIVAPLLLYIWLKELVKCLNT
ncbi:TPA: hypothetical protein CPU00_04435 [Candidatus Gastranaerophilales bacterium HUM_18]|nr:MAG TPA: hypothetical protein CPU00_04435 [Candidatus Gastranaerophilales bacterium HUM_18]